MLLLLSSQTDPCCRMIVNLRRFASFHSYGQSLALFLNHIMAGMLHHHSCSWTTLAAAGMRRWALASEESDGWQGCRWAWRCHWPSCAGQLTN